MYILAFEKGGGNRDAVFIARIFDKNIFILSPNIV
jgi:hypothetical protein